MKTIPRDPDVIPNPKTNPAISMIMDTLDHHGVCMNEASKAMSIPRSRLSAIKRGEKRVSVDTAIRFEAYTGVPAEFLLRVQSNYEFQKAYHECGKEIIKEVSPIAAA